ncbi:hypothetical protein CVT24_007369 [Panaeolus cyanescens]|uniref:Uncharacterized protein n=1 Tax=Panaeolus cyanescens TaxID=181874 RepID=A0A409YKY6_9AGAR|nr:hypothetical protein CVT24_007369 [Panaeolus cyanescens]
MGVPLTEQSSRGMTDAVTARAAGHNKSKQSGAGNDHAKCLDTHSSTPFLPLLGSKAPLSHLQNNPGDPAEIIDKALADSALSPSSALDHSVMHRNGVQPSLILNDVASVPFEDSAAPQKQQQSQRPPLEWDWTIEHADRKKERKADAALHGATPFEVDRKVLKDVVREKMGVEVGRIAFLSAGTFHKAYLVTLADHSQLVARVARRFMPRLKTESEVATINYLRENTSTPVPTIYHYDSNPYNRLGGEFILMSKAPGIPVSQVYHGLAYNDLVKLLKNLAAIVIPLFAHRFNGIGSLYFGPDPRNLGAQTPQANANIYSAVPFSPTLGMAGFSSATPTPKQSSISVPTLRSLQQREYHVGPIISWPFFGSNRGELIHPHELNRGPWASTHSYLESCVHREVQGVIREVEGRSAPHRLHLDPDEIKTSRHHRLRAVPGDESDDSDEWNLEESEDEWEGPGDAMYRDYRRMQRSTFLIAHMTQREDAVRREMGRWKNLMERLVSLTSKQSADGPEEFGLDCHDLSLENVFVDEHDNTKITCIIDWESTTTRPLWACAHVPAFLQSSAFVTKLFREIVSNLPSDPTVQIELPKSCKKDLSALCKEWLYYETAGIRLRMAHRCAEWDGWEEGLVDSILGAEEFESEWFAHWGSGQASLAAAAGAAAGAKRAAMRAANGEGESEHAHNQAESSAGLSEGVTSPVAHGVVGRGGVRLPNGKPMEVASRGVVVARGGFGGAVKLSSKLPLMREMEKEQMLNTTGDICGGRGGELGRRLEAWLTVSGQQAETWTEEASVDVEAR